MDNVVKVAVIFIVSMFRGVFQSQTTVEQLFEVVCFSHRIHETWYILTYMTGERQATQYTWICSSGDVVYFLPW